MACYAFFSPRLRHETTARVYSYLELFQWIYEISLHGSLWSRLRGPDSHVSYFSVACFSVVGSQFCSPRCLGDGKAKAPETQQKKVASTWEQ